MLEDNREDTTNESKTVMKVSKKTTIDRMFPLYNQEV